MKMNPISFRLKWSFVKSIPGVVAAAGQLVEAAVESAHKVGLQVVVGFSVILKKSL
jgi:delta-aminolevulinic acid dehydratase/porphobilinogen synthase